MGKESSQAHGGLWVRLTARVGNPLRWSGMSKAALVSGTFTYIALQSAAVNTYRLEEGAIPPYLRRASLALAVEMLWIFAAVCAVLFILTLAFRKRSPENKSIVHGTVQLMAAATGLACYAMGPYTSPFWIAFLLGGAPLGLLLFDRQVVFGGLLNFLGITFVTTLFERIGRIPYAPLLEGPPFIDGRLSTPWIVLMGGGSLSVAVLAMLLMDYVIRHWREDEALLERLSTTDVLTGILNRRAFLTRATEEFERATRYPRPLACVIVDLDHFKKINDTHGHLTGDRALVTAAATLQTLCRTTDVLARYGGEEFALLLPETNLESARQMAERCREKIAAQVVTDGEMRLQVTASLGVAALPHDGVGNFDDLVRLADEALYKAKGNGRNRVETAS